MKNTRFWISVLVKPTRFADGMRVEEGKESGVQISPGFLARTNARQNEQAGDRQSRLGNSGLAC